LTLCRCKSGRLLVRRYRRQDPHPGGIGIRILLHRRQFPAGSLTESQAGRITITSGPIGAAVYTDGTEIGTTPLQIAPTSHFRSGFAGFSCRYTGKLTLKKAGCDARSTEVKILCCRKTCTPS
jgi:hypothetical protein